MAGVSSFACTFIVIAVFDPSVMNVEVRSGSCGDIVAMRDSVTSLIRVARPGVRVTVCVCFSCCSCCVISAATVSSQTGHVKIV